MIIELMIIKCFDCDTCIEEDDIYALCPKCYEKKDENLSIKNILDETLNFFEKETENLKEMKYSPHESEENKKLFKKAYQRGMLDIIFWIADLDGDEGINHFEKVFKEYWNNPND